MEKTLPKVLPSKGRDKSVGAKGDTEGADAISSNNKLVGYRKTCGQAVMNEGDALGRLHLKVNEGGAAICVSSAREGKIQSG